MGKVIKISFLGDIMCEPLLLKAAKKGKIYDFCDLFSEVKDLFGESDFIVGNLETPLAGKEAGFTKELFSFNAPDEFAAAIKKSGINFVSTANNHCMDRGLEGLKRTVRVLDEVGLCHGGTYDDNKKERVPFVTVLGENRIAIIPFTYGTNYGTHHQALPSDGYVDLLHSDTEPIYVKTKKGKLSKAKAVLFKSLKQEQIAAIKKSLGMEYNKARKDDYLNENTAKPYFDKLDSIIHKSKNLADLTIFYPHVGGQFNNEPGIFSEYTIQKALDYGVDAIIASHPHVIQKAVVKENVPVFYSVGNFSMSPNSVYLLHDNLPEYGLMVHLYIQRKRIVKTTFSILKIVEEKGKTMVIWPVDKISNPNEKDICRIVQTVTGRELSGNVIQHEYELQ